MSVLILCSSPSCAATVEIHSRHTVPALEAHGWAVERQQFDLRPVPYCPRCAGSEDE